MFVAMLGALALANPYAAKPGSGSSASPFQWQVPGRAVGSIELVLTVPEGYAIYRDRLGVVAVKGTIGEPVFPPAELKPDLYEPGKWRASYTTDVVVTVPVVAVDGGRVELELTQQGCREGLCWPIETTTHTVAVVLPKATEE